MYKVIATGKQGSSQQAMNLRQQLKWLNESIEYTSVSALMVQFLHVQSGFTFQSSPGKEQLSLPEILGLVHHTKVQHLEC